MNSTVPATNAPVVSTGGQVAAANAPEVRVPPVFRYTKEDEKKQWEMRTAMMARTENHPIYNNSSYGPLTCLWSSQKSVREVPQTVKQAPSGYQLYTSVKKLAPQEKGPKWGNAQKGLWKARAAEIKEEQNEQLELGAIKFKEEGSGEESD